MVRLMFIYLDIINIIFIHILFFEDAEKSTPCEHFLFYKRSKYEFLNDKKKITKRIFIGESYII